MVGIGVSILALISGLALFRYFVTAPRKWMKYHSNGTFGRTSVWKSVWNRRNKEEGYVSSGQN